MKRSARVTAALLLGLLATVALGQERKPLSSKAENRPLQGKTLTQWVKEISSPDPGVRETAIQAVALYGHDAAKLAGKALIRELHDRDPSIRANAAVTLGATGVDTEDAPEAVRGLISLLRDQQMVVRFRAAVALGGFSSGAGEAVQPLIYALRDPSASWEVRRACVYALGTRGFDPQGGANPKAVRALMDSFQDPCAQVRLEAVLAICTLGKPPNANERQWTRTALQRLLNDRDPTVTIWTHVALMRIQDKPSEREMQAIATYLKNPRNDVRIHAARALGSLGKEAASQIPDLEALLGDPDQQVVLIGVQALAAIGRASVPALSMLLRNKDPQYVLLGINAFAAMGEEANAAVPELKSLQSNSNEVIRNSAKAAVDAIGKAAMKSRVEGVR